MKKRFIIAIIQIFLLTTVVRGQQENLILNGSLEDFINCPVTPNITEAKFWSTGLEGNDWHIEYFHACAGHVPVFGTSWVQSAKDGDAFFGAGNSIGIQDTSVSQEREFSTGRLKYCLQAGARYKLSFYVNPPPNQVSAYVGYDCFEVFFHPNAYPLSSQNYGITSRFYEVAHLALKMPVNRPITQRGVWHKLEVEFTATGEECYFTVGCFKWLKPENIDTLVGPGATGNVFRGIYYLDDDFVLTEIPDDTTPPAPEPLVTNVFTPNADGHNDYWVIKHLPPATSVAIYNRWGQRVYFSENYANDWGGEGLPSGTYIAELVFRDLPPKRQAVYLKRE
jgi:gliding motility-associated-like protein